MKKLLGMSPILLSILFLYYPIICCISKVLDVKFVLYHGFGATLVITILTVIVTLTIHRTKVELNKVNRVVTAFLPFLAVMSGALYIINSIDNTDLSWMLIFMGICMGCTIYLFIKYPANLMIKLLGGIAAGVLYLFFVLIFCFGYFFYLLFGGGLSKVTVVQTVRSRTKAYTAQVIEYDGGLRSGDVVVQVLESSKNINLLIGEFVGEKKEFYSGNSEETEDMRVVWLDETTLLINGSKYKISEEWIKKGITNE